MTINNLVLIYNFIMINNTDHYTYTLCTIIIEFIDPKANIIAFLLLWNILTHPTSLSIRSHRPHEKPALTRHQPEKKDINVGRSSCRYTSSRTLSRSVATTHTALLNSSRARACAGSGFRNDRCSCAMQKRLKKAPASITRDKEGKTRPAR